MERGLKGLRKGPIQFSVRSIERLLQPRKHETPKEDDERKQIV